MPPERRAGRSAPAFDGARDALFEPTGRFAHDDVGLRIHGLNEHARASCTTTALAHVTRQSVDDLRFPTEGGMVSMTSLASLVTDDTRFLREAALAGLGVAMLPEPIVARELAAGHLH